MTKKQIAKEVLSYFSGTITLVLDHPVVLLYHHDPGYPTVLPWLIVTEESASWVRSHRLDHGAAELGLSPDLQDLVVAASNAFSMTQ